MNMSAQSTEDSAQFYDLLAGVYDEMTGFDARFQKEAGFYADLVRTNRIETVLDAGCGTGFHAILLARLGVRATALDSSPQMIAQTARRAAALGLPVATAVSALTDIPAASPGPFDAVLCAGNTFPHLLTPQEQRQTVDGFFRVTRPGGVCLMQMLNYFRNGVAEIRSEREAGGRRYIRTHVRSGKNVTFTIEIRTASQDDGYPLKQSAVLRAVDQPELVSLMTAAGFSITASLGSLTGERFDPDLSQDLIVLARKPV